MRKLKGNSAPETLGGRARDELKKAIISGEFMPGETVTIRALASTLNISIMPAREALVNLAAEGVLDLKDNRSLSIPSLTPKWVREIERIRVCLAGC